jgi:hypothetical protein
MMILPYRWLIDNDKEMEGLQVISDLHGGDPDDPIAMAVYQEIKDKVREEVCISHVSKSMVFLNIYLSENLEKEDHIDKCGRSTNDVFFLQCRH